MDSSGLLWVFCTVGSPEYQRGYPNGRRETARDAGVAEVERDNIDYDRLYDTWIEVIDPEAGGVVARLRFDEPVLSVLSDAKAAVRGLTEAGDPLVLIHQFELRAPDNGYH